MIITKKIKAVIIWGFAILVFSLFFGSRIFQTINKNIEAGRKISDLKNSISDLEEQNDKLKNFIDSFKKQSYIEKEAKARLNLKNPGEKVVVIIEEELKKTGDDLKEKSNSLEKIWQAIKNSFKQWGQ